MDAAEEMYDENLSGLDHGCRLEQMEDLYR